MKKIKNKSIKGDKVLLEPFCLEKANEFFELYVHSWLTWDRFIALGFSSLKEAEAFIEKQIGNEFCAAYFIIERVSGKMVGFILGDKLSPMFVARTRAVGMAFEGKGYAYEASLLFDKLARKAGFIGVSVFVTKENVYLLRLIEREGVKWLTSKNVRDRFTWRKLEVYCKPL